VSNLKTLLTQTFAPNCRQLTRYLYGQQGSSRSRSFNMEFTAQKAAEGTNWLKSFCTLEKEVVY